MLKGEGEENDYSLCLLSDPQCIQGFGNPNHNLFKKKTSKLSYFAALLWSVHFIALLLVYFFKIFNFYRIHMTCFFLLLVK